MLGIDHTRRRDIRQEHATANHPDQHLQRIKVYLLGLENGEKFPNDQLPDEHAEPVLYLGWENVSEAGVIFV